MKTTLEQGNEKQIPPIPFGLGRNDSAVVNEEPRVETGTDRWAAACASAGAAVWAGLAVLARMGIARLGAIELLFLFAPLVIVPLGLELGRVLGGGGPLQQLARRLQPAGAALAVVAMWLPPGRKAGFAALGWLLICMLVAGDRVLKLLRALTGKAGGSPFDYRSGQVRAARIAMGIAQLDLAVGGAWLVASRLGMRPMGLPEPIGLLTAVHFHFAGFATATIAAATLQFAERGWLKPVVAAVLGMPFVVAAGFVISPALKMGAAVLFSASVAGLAIFVRACGRQAKDATARVLLQVAAGAVFAGMVLSGIYAVADFFGSDVLTIPQMARTHGILNAVGFCLPGMLGWLVEYSGRA